MTDPVDWKVELWDAIMDLVQACGGDPRIDGIPRESKPWETGTACLQRIERAVEKLAPPPRELRPATQRFILEEDARGRYWAAYREGGDVEIFRGHENEEIFPLDLRFTTTDISLGDDAFSRVPTGAVVEMRLPLVEVSKYWARCTVCDIRMMLSDTFPNAVAARLEIFRDYHRLRCVKKEK